MSNLKVTDKDREAGDTLIRTWLRDRDPKGLTQRVIEAIAQAREEGRREEREACAVIADDMLCPNAANAIRARGED